MPTYMHKLSLGDEGRKMPPMSEFSTLSKATNISRL